MTRLRAVVLLGLTVPLAACALPAAGLPGDATPPASEAGTNRAPDRDAALHPDHGSRSADAATGTDAAKDAVHPAEGGTLHDTGVGLDARGADAHTHDAAPPVFTLVQSVQANTTGTTGSVALSPTKAGSFLAVLAILGAVGPTVTSIIDDATGGTNTYVSANLRSLAGTCQASEIWYARDTRAGATSIKVTVSSRVAIATWVLEVSGMASSGGVDNGAAASNQAVSTVISAPTVDTSGAPALIAAAVGSCGIVSNVVAGNPFIELPVQNGNTALYDIATTGGSYGPVLSNSFNTWNASVAAFR